MKSRHKKLALIGGALAIIGIIAALVLNALNSNIALYISPTDVADGVTVSFIVTDTAKDIAVHYKGILPDLFKEGKGVVAQGKLNADSTFVASEVLAKHDENYMPPEAAKAVEDAQKSASKHVSPSSVSQPKASY